MDLTHGSNLDIRVPVHTMHTLPAEAGLLQYYSSLKRALTNWLEKFPTQGLHKRSDNSIFPEILMSICRKGQALPQGRWNATSRPSASRSRTGTAIADNSEKQTDTNWQLEDEDLEQFSS